MISKFLYFSLTVAATVLLIDVNGIVVQKRFMKVAMKTIFRVCQLSANNLLQETVTLTLQQCARRCLLDTKCVTYCFNYDKSLCATTTVFPSHWFPGIPPQANITATYDVCYSSWTSPDSIIRDTMVTSSSPATANYRTSELFVDGYFCHTDGYEARRSDGKTGFRNYLQVDFGKNFLVAEIRVAHHLTPYYFESVTVRLGLSSTETDNAIIAQLPTEVPPLGYVKILLNPPVWGRYLHFQSGGTNYFALGELQVIPAV